MCSLCLAGKNTPFKTYSGGPSKLAFKQELAAIADFLWHLFDSGISLSKLKVQNKNKIHTIQLMLLFFLVCFKTHGENPGLSMSRQGWFLGDQVTQDMLTVFRAQFEYTLSCIVIYAVSSFYFNVFQISIGVYEHMPHMPVPVFGETNPAKQIYNKHGSAAYPKKDAANEQTCHCHHETVGFPWKLCLSCVANLISFSERTRQEGLLLRTWRSRRNLDELRVWFKEKGSNLI